VPRPWSFAVALLTFLVYLALVPPVSGDKDSAEFTIALALLGVAHPTGYPLFTLLGHAWVTALHALGISWEWAANAWTALGGAVAIYFLQRLALALLPPDGRLSRAERFGSSLLPVGLFALNPVWTYETTLVEVYAWHVAWALGAAMLFVSTWRSLADPARDLRGLAVRWGLVCGIGLAHHATSVFVVLPLTVAFVIALRGRPWRGAAVLGLLAACVPLLSYGLILWRGAHPAALQWPMLRPGWDGFFEHVSGRQYVGLLGKFAPASPQVNFLVWYILPFLLPGLALLALHARRSKDGAAIALAAAALAGTLYAFSYGVPDPSSYFLYPMAFGLAALAPLLAPASRLLKWLVASVAAVLCIVWFFFASVRSTDMMQFDALVKSMWQAIPYEQGFVFWNDDMHYKLELRQRLLHEKPGLFVVDASVLRDPEARRKFALAHGFEPAAAAPDLAVEESVNEKTRLPVVDFDPMTKQVRLLKKP
jgi:hypothetical protein